MEMDNEKNVMEMNNERYSRQTMLPEIGTEGQRHLAAARVAVIGLGGLGSAVLPYLAGAGVGSLVLVDPDTVSLSNLQRQVLYSQDEIGQPKALCAARRITALNGDVSVTAVPEALDEDNGRDIIAGCDLVIDCTDNFATRYLIDDICAGVGLPWVYGSIGEFAGQVAILNHRSGVRYRDIYPDREALCALPRVTRGVLGAVPGVIGTIQASEALKLIIGCGDNLDGRLLVMNLLTMESDIIDLR